MTTGVLITLIICITLVALSIINRNNNNKKER